MKTKDYEVVVVGGGPAGAAAAITLARAGRQVLLVESSGDTAFKIGEGLPPAARPLLQDMDLWESFVAQDHLPSYGNLSAWGSHELTSTDFIYDPNGSGWHLDRSRFDALVREKAIEAGANVSSGTKLNIKPCRLSGDSWLLSLTRNNSERKVLSRWLVDATGRRCSIARAQGAHRHADDALVAIFALFSHPENSQPTDYDSRTLIEAVPEGWWYTALLPSGLRVVVFLTDSDLAPASLRTKRGYRLLLSRSEHVSACLETYHHELQTNVKAVSANTARLGSATGEGWVAVGDAALSFDPVSSQGILTALFTGMTDGQALDEKLSGNSAALSEYAERLKIIYGAYLQNRSVYYGLEQRWANRPFWQRRHHLK